MKTLALWGTVTPLSFRATTRHPAFKLFSKLLTVFGIAMMFAVSGWSTNTYYKSERSFTTNHVAQKLASFNITGDFNVTGASAQCAVSGNQCTTSPGSTFTVKTKHIKDVPSLSNLNSASATLEIPAGATIKWAGLLWQGHIHGSKSDINNPADASAIPNAVKNAGKNYDIVKFRTPDGIVHTIDIDHTDSNVTNHFSLEENDEYRFFYQGFEDVTDIVKNSYSPTAKIFTVGDIQSTDGDTREMKDPIDNWQNEGWRIGNHANWSLVVVFEEPSYSFQNVSVYDGFKIMKVITSGDFTTPMNIPIHIDGFYTPASGTVNSKLMFYAGGGNKSAARDSFEILNANTGIMDKLTNAVNPSDNVFNDTFSYFGTNVNSTYHHLMDIDTFDISSKMTNSQSETDINLYVQYSNGGADIAFVGLVAFSTELYKPEICYYEDVYKGGVKLTTGAQVNKGDMLNVKVYATNQGDATAENIKIYRTFDTLLPYVEDSTRLDNNNPTYLGTYTMTDQTDNVDTDTFDYNSSDKKFQIRIGTDASPESGGDLVKNQGAAFDYNLTMNSEQNTSISYEVAYTNTAINFDYVGQIGKCVDFNNTFWGYSAPQSVFGDFNVVYADHANGALSSGYYYNLPTQITSRADKYKVISLDGNTLKDINTTVAIDLVDADSSADCSTMTRISGLKTWIPFTDDNTSNLFAQNIIDGMVLYDANAAKKFYQKAGKNVKFRISYPKDGSGGNVIMNETVPGKFHLNNFPSYAGDTCVSPVTATTYNPANGNIQGEHTYTQVPQACGNAGQSGASAMTQHEVNVCLECIYGTSVNYACSKDNFAIRPEGFFVKLNDQNQTNSASKQFMMNNTPSPANKNMASGYRYYMEVNATNHLGDASSLDYNTTENVDFVWNSAQTGCNDDTNKTVSFSFANGLADGNVSVDQVGEYRLSIVDTAWAAVDSNTSLMTHHTGSYFIGGEDCTPNSTISNAVKTTGIGSSAVLNGCNISTNHTNTIPDPDVTYTDSDVTFRPYKFDMTTINFGVGIQPQEINATSGPDFVYMSDINRTDSMNMSLRATGTISARGENNSTLSNFVDNCYAVNTNLSMNTYNNITLANTTYQVRFIDTNASGTLYDSNATDVATGALTLALMTLDDGNFTKDMSGSLNTVTRLNYDRNQTTPLNPMTVQYGTLGFKCVTTSECTMQADLSGSHEAVGSKVMDFNVTHIYGRIIPRDVRVFGNVPFVANAWYEGYNLPTLNGISLEASKNDALWYVNNVHIDANDGDGNVTVIIPTTPLALPTHSSSTTGMETYQFSAIPLADIPYGGKAHINTDPWLWYGINALNYADPVNSSNLDCLTHPCFNITVVPSIGATGSAKSTNEATKASKKSDSEVGASGWKSTSDYAPAIR